MNKLFQLVQGLPISSYCKPAPIHSIYLILLFSEELGIFEGNVDNQLVFQILSLNHLKKFKFKYVITYSYFQRFEKVIEKSLWLKRKRTKKMKEYKFIGN